MPKFLALYWPTMVSKLSYMLQSVEYDTVQFWRWWWYQPDFRDIDHQRLKSTAKSRLILGVGGLVYVGLLAIAICLWARLWSELNWPNFLLAITLTSLIPILLALTLTAITLLGRWLVQLPLEAVRRRAVKSFFAGFGGQVIVIAGSYGKTSMKHVLTSVLGTALKVAATPGNFNTPAGIRRFVDSLTGDEDVIIVEAGEYRPGDVAHICSLVGPDMGFITGVNEQHLTHMKSVDKALSTVFELAQALPPKSPLYINAESPYLAEHITRRDLAYSREGVDGWKVLQMKTGLNGTSLKLKPARGKAFEVKTSLMGRHQAGPIAAAAHLAHRLGLRPAEIKTGFKRIEAYSRRFKPQEIDGITVIDDSYNGNPDGFLAGIDFLNDLGTKRRLVYVTPGMIELGRLSADTHHAVGLKLAGSPIKQVVLYRNPATQHIARGLEAGQYRGELTWLTPQDNFLDHLSQLTQSGDVVLLQNSPREAFFYL